MSQVPEIRIRLCNAAAARRRLVRFLVRHLAQYHHVANDPDADTRSGQSPYLHFGHLAEHELFHEVMSREGWSPERLPERATGKRQGWWGASAGATHDELLNAAQTQLVPEGRIHDYLRMLWPKKILECAATPHDALSVMIQLNDRHALDGRDPNAYSRILWRLGHYDRPWGPDRLSFGMVRCMSSENTRRKLSVTECLRQFAQHHATSSEGVPIRGKRACSAAQRQHAADGATAPPPMASVRRRTSAVAWPASVCVRRSIDSHSPEVCE